MNTLESLDSAAVTNNKFNFKSLKRYYPWLVIAMISLFLFYKYVLQIGPSVMTDQLMQQFDLSGAGLGNLAASFFYSYLITQLLAGLLLDKFSPRVLTALAISCCAIGALTFPHASTLLEACLSRALIGVGAAFATISYMKLTAMWFKPSQFAFIGGLLATAAMTGSMAGQLPMAYLVSKVGWQHALSVCGDLGIVLAVLFFLIVKDKPANQLTQPKANSSLTLAGIAAVLKQKHNWYLMLYSGLAFSPLAVFGGLWGNPFLRTAYHLSKTQAASMVSLMFLGLALGSPLLGFISDKLNARFGTMLLSSLISLACLTIVLYAGVLPTIFLGGLLFFFGLGTGGFMLGFAVGKEINNIALAATVIALINTGDAIFGAITEPLVGKVLDIFERNQSVSNIHVFSLQSFHYAMLLLPVYLILALGFLLLLRPRL